MLGMSSGEEEDGRRSKWMEDVFLCSIGRVVYFVLFEI